MALNDIETKIRDEGKSEIKKINAEADRHIKIIVDWIEAEAKKEAEKVLKEGNTNIDLVKRQIESDAKIKSKEIIESEKNIAVNDVIEKAIDKIMNMDDKKKKEIIEKLANEGREEIKDAEILVDRKYARLLKNATPTDLGDFGVLIKSRDGKVCIDNTIRNRIKSRDSVLKSKIASILFD